MENLVRRLIGKYCIIHLTHTQISGVIQEVEDGAMTVEENGATQVVNLIHVIRIYEYPNVKKDKKATKKLFDALKIEE